MIRISLVKLSKWFLVFGVVALLVGCSSADKVGQSWVGSPATRLLAEWGAPSRTAEVDDTTIYTWERRNGYGQIKCQQTLVVRGGFVVDHSSDCGYLITR